MTDDKNLIALAVEVVAHFVANNPLSPDEVPAFIASTHAAVAALGRDGRTSDPSPAREPAVSVRRSLASRDHILSLIDGKPYKSLKRHLKAHGLTPAQYRDAFGLKPDYPMVAPAYSEARRTIAERMGLGRGRRAKDEAVVMSSTAEAERPPGAEAAGVTTTGSAPTAIDRPAAQRPRRKLSIAV